MKANEFIKKFGLKLAQRNIAALDSGFIKHDDFLEHYGFDILDDLKRLIESHELVVQCGGLEDARSHLESIRFNIATKTWFGQALLNWSIYADKLEKAIADVESCQ